MTNIFIYISLTAGLFFAHPVHISVSNAEISGNNIDMTLRAFRDDLQTAYFHYHSKPIDYSMEENLKSDWMTAYLKKSVIMIAKPVQDTINLEYINARQDGDAVVFEFTGKLPDRINSLYIYNGFLLDIYSDQSNLMIFGTSGSERGMKFDAWDAEQELKLQQ